MPNAIPARWTSLLIYTIAPNVLRNLCLSVSALLLIYCIYYLAQGIVWVATGGLISAGSFLALGAMVMVRGHHPGVVSVMLGMAGINIGAVIAMIALGPLGIVWYAPLVFVNLLFGGLFAGTITTLAAISLMVTLGDLYQDVDFVINIIGALILSFFLATTYSVTRRMREGELRSQANIDSLTGALNRRGLDQALMRSLNDPDAAAELSLLMLDLDHFKALNDNHGHQAGDAVLKEFVSLLRKNLRKGDEVYRYGGEEFSVPLEANGDKAMIAAEKIRTAVREHEFLDGLDVTVSIGIAEARPGESCGELVQRADAALYEAKRAGRNRCNLAAAP